MNCIHLSGGEQLINSTNITQTICKGNAAYTCWNYPKSHRISYSTIYNNTADDNSIMYHYDKNQYIARCNVIQNTHNTLGDYDWGIVYIVVVSFLMLAIVYLNQILDPFYSTISIINYLMLISVILKLKILVHNQIMLLI